MTEIVGYDQPPLESLTHHGVLGMKWGHHKAQGGDSGGSSSEPAKKSKPTKEDILNARSRQEARINLLNSLGDKHALATSEKGRAKIEAEFNKVAGETFNSKDAKLAAKMTTGEKWVAGISWGVFGAVAAGSVAIQVASKRH